MGRLLLDEINQIKDLYMQGLSLKQIADKLGCTPQNVHLHLIRLGIDRRRRGRTKVKVDDEIVQKIYELYSNGKSTIEIAKILNFSIFKVWCILRDNKMLRPPGNRHFSKIAEAQQLIAKGLGFCKVADMIGVSHNTVYHWNKKGYL